MRKEKALTTLLQDLVKLLDEECERNPEFSERLQNVLTPLPGRRAIKKKKPTKKSVINLPDIHERWQALGESEFRLWLRDQPVEVLRGLIKKHDLDAMRRTIRWKENEKLSAFITDQLLSRLSRGSSFLRTEDKAPRRPVKKE